MHVASFVHSNGSSLFTIIHWPWCMNQTDWTRSINNVINIPRTIIHPTPPRPVAEHDTTWSSAAEHQQRDQHSTNDNTPHPTPLPTPPRPVAEHDTTRSSAAEHQQRDQHSTNDNTPHPTPHPTLPCRGAWYNVIICSGASTTWSTFHER